MAKIRVYELAKNLNMTNKALLTKIEKMDIEVGSHMSSLDDETVELIKTNLFGKKESDLEEKRVKSTVIRRRKKSSDTQPGSDDDVSKSAEDEVADEGADTTIASAADVEDKIEVASEPPAAEVTQADEQAQTQQPEDTTEAQVVDTSADSDVVTTAETTDDAPVVPKKTKPKEPAARIIKPAPSVTDKADPEAESSVSATPEEPIQTTAQEEIPSVEATASAEPESTDDASPVTVETTAESDELPSEAEATDQKEDDIAGQKKGKKKKKYATAKIIRLPDPVDTEALAAKPGKGKPKAGPKPFGTEAAPAGPAPDRAGEKPFKKAKKAKGGRDIDIDETDAFSKKKSKRKTIVEGNALYAGGRGRKGRKGAKGAKGAKAVEGQKTQITVPKAIKRRIKIDETIILAELAKRMGIKANDMIAKLMGLGVMATVNQTIDYDTASLVASEFGFEVEKASFEEETILNLESTTDTDPDKQLPRPPVVTIMGHVDHGKTSLLDVIRKSSIADGEAGGITQHIGAYHVETPSGQVVFLDTPGHEAFTAMRSRGAKVTDIVILVVAADDGVMPQTIEALNHAKAAKVPIIVAVNKIDKEGAEPDRIKRELSDHNVIPEDWGGDTIFVNVSAKQKIGISDLLEMILLQAEVLELKANPDRFATGHVVESKLDSGRGPLATVLIQEGTLKTGQSIVCGIHYGKIRAMFNDQGQQVSEAGPSIPVEIIGLTGVPEAGDEMVALAADKDAKQVSSHRIQKARAKELAKNSRLSLEGLFEQMAEGIVKDLNLIIKADVHGSIEALKESLSKLATDEVKINVIHSATGTVTESDVSLAAVSNAIILGFNVRPATKVQELAKEENVDMRFYDIIYDAIKDLKDAMVGLMESTFKEVVLGRADVRDTFVIPKRGTVAGCYVTEGKIQRGQRVRLLRDGIIIYDGNISSLKRFKDDAKEVQHGYECGIGIENYNDIKIGDTIDCYMLEEVKPTLD